MTERYSNKLSNHYEHLSLRPHSLSVGNSDYRTNFGVSNQPYFWLMDCVTFILINFQSINNFINYCLFFQRFFIWSFNKIDQLLNLLFQKVKEGNKILKIKYHTNYYYFSSCKISSRIILLKHFFSKLSRLTFISTVIIGDGIESLQIITSPLSTFLQCTFCITRVSHWPFVILLT